MTEEFQAIKVKEKIDGVFKESKDIERCREMFLEEIMDWTDYFTENCAEDWTKNDDSFAVLNELATLWIYCGQFEGSLKQYKNAVDIYEKALQDPYVSKTAKIYQAFAEYWWDRKKPGNAQKAVIRGLCGDLSRSESDNLWRFLLRLTNQITNQPSTFQQLYTAVKSQVAENLPLAPLPADTETSAESKDFPQVKVEEKAEEAQPHQQSIVKEVPSLITELNPIDIKPTALESVPNRVESKKLFEDLDNLTGMTPEQVVHIFRNRPFMLFVAPNQEPMASGLSNLNRKEIQILETFFGVPLHSLTVFDEKMIKDPDRMKAEHYLDILEGLYFQQALKERHFDAWFSELKALHATEEKAVVNKLKMNPGGFSQQHPDMKKFRNHCAVQVELLSAIINKIMFTLLIEQIRVLSELHFPFFTMNFQQQLLDELHQKKVALQNQQLKEIQTMKTFFPPVITQDLLYQQKILCSLLSIRLHLTEQQRYNKLRFMQKQGNVPSVQNGMAAPNSLLPPLDIGGKGASGMKIEERRREDANKRRRRNKRRRSKASPHGNSFGHEDADYEDGPDTPRSHLSEEGSTDGNDYPLLARQYSNSYSEASITSYTQNAYQNDVMLNEILGQHSPLSPPQGSPLVFAEEGEEEGNDETLMMTNDEQNQDLNEMKESTE